MTKEQEEAIERLQNRIKEAEDYKTTQVFLTTDIRAIDIVLSILEEKDRQIDLILDKFIDGTGYYFSEFDYMNKEEIKQYFENKVRQESDKGATGK